MLGPEERSVLRDLLRPPVDAQLDIAVTTTFTLDLTSALVAPLAFASFDLEGVGDPVAVLEAIRSAASRVSIFAQVGYIRVPDTASDLMAFLEPMVHEVTPPNSGYLFHPKIWVLRFQHSDDSQSYRLVCGSRNLTGDVSWDAVIAIDGYIDSRQAQATNRPLADLVRGLPRMAISRVEPRRAHAIQQLADELRAVTWTLPDRASGLAFHALGIDLPDAGPSLWDSIADRRTLVISPFLDDDAVDDFRADCHDLTIVSRPDAFERLHPDTLDGLDCRVLDPLAGLGDLNDDTTTGGMLGGLHAKIYVSDYGRSASLIIGSPNATTAGLDDHNVEFAVEVFGTKAVYGVDQLLGDNADLARALNEYVPAGGLEETAEDEVARELENLLRRIATIRFHADISPIPPHEPGAWSKHVKSALPVDIRDEITFSLRPLTLPGNTARHDGGDVNAVFRLDTTADITPFICLEVRQEFGGSQIVRATVVRAELHGDPPGRLDDVLARQVDTPEKFLRFLMLMLSFHGGPPVPEVHNESGGTWGALGAFGDRGIFESLMRALADHPAALDDLDRLIDRLKATDSGRQVLPDGFGDLWETVMNARSKIGTSR
jgi:hypothetical protein